LFRAFVTNVRPILEYNSIVWSPSLLRDMEQVEKVQGPFTKRPFGKRWLWRTITKAWPA